MNSYDKPILTIIAYKEKKIQSNIKSYEWEMIVNLNAKSCMSCFCMLKLHQHASCCTGGAPYWLAIGHANEWIWTNLTWNLSSRGPVFLEKSWSSTLRSSWSQFFWPLINGNKSNSILGLNHIRNIMMSLKELFIVVHTGN